MRLISVANILPKGLYVENAVKVGTGWNLGLRSGGTGRSSVLSRYFHS